MADPGRRDPPGRAALTYPEAGATRSGPLPSGYRHLHVRHRLGPGDLDLVGGALLTWGVHAAAHVTVRADAPRAEPGVRVRTSLGVRPLRVVVPCEVVWAETAATWTGFGYGSLPGHPFVGEEAFRVERDAAGVLWFAVDAFSRPAWRALAPVAPAVPVVQHAYLRVLALGARRLTRRTRAPRGEPGR